MKKPSSSTASPRHRSPPHIRPKSTLRLSIHHRPRAPNRQIRQSSLHFPSSSTAYSNYLDSDRRLTSGRNRSSRLSIHHRPLNPNRRIPQSSLHFPSSSSSTASSDYLEVAGKFLDREISEKRHVSFEYGRYGKSTTAVVEEKISALEGAESTLIMASGMCASTITLMALVPAGGHIVTTTDCYRKTRIFIETMLRYSDRSCRYGILEDCSE